jgi:WD40 repeat protein/tRNA A-37 threonylcarbamoyl transferase component Bud32
MTDENSKSTEREQRVNGIIAAYLEAERNGQAPDPRAILEQHPDLAAELQSFFADKERFNRLAEPIPPTRLPVTAEAPTLGPTGPPPTSGTTVRYFGDYELLEEIARGGMGIVYKARQISLNRDVALKMILAGQLASEVDVQRFRAEAEAAANLDHPNIVPIYEVGEHEGQQYFSMKLIHGGSLSQELPRFRKDPRAIAQLLATVARAVHQAHQHGILHRDLKPANILLDAQGNPHVTDFGLAKRVEGDHRITQSGAIVGTPSYMAPEQATAKKGLTTAVDVYSLGAILYELVTGQPPFRAETPLDTVLQVLDKEPKRPRSINATADRDLETICLKCLEKEPHKRYASAEALAEELERWLAGEPIRARPSGTGERAWKWARRKPAAAALLAVSGLALSCLLTASVWFTAHLQRERDNVQKERDNARERLWQSLYEQARAERLLGDRPRALRVLADAARMKPSSELRQEAILAITSPGVRMLQEIPIGHVFSMKFSADGRILAVHGKYAFGSGWQTGDPDRETVQFLKAWRMPSGQPLGSTKLRAEGEILGCGMSGYWPGGFDKYAPFEWSPNSELIAVLSEDGKNLRLWDPFAGNDVAELPGQADSHVIFSRDGALAALLEPGKGQRTIGIWNIRKRQLEKRVTFGLPIAFLSDDELLVSSDRLRRIGTTTGDERFSTPEGMMPLVVSADGRIAALFKSKSQRGDPVMIWDLSSGREIATLPAAVPEGYNPFGMQFSRDGRRFAFDDPSRPYTVKMWDYTTGEIKELAGVIYGEGNWNLFQRGGFSPNGSLLVTYAQKNTNVLHIWDVDHERRIATLRDVHTPVWSDDGRLLATIAPGKVARPDGSQYGNDRTFVRVWEVAYPTPTHFLNKPIETMSFHPQGTELAVNDMTLQVDWRPPQPLLLPSSYKRRGDQTFFANDGSQWVADMPHTSSEAKPFRLLQITPTVKEFILQKPVVPHLQQLKSFPDHVDKLKAVLLPLPNSLALDPGRRHFAIICQVHWQWPNGSSSASVNERILAVWDLYTNNPPIICKIPTVTEPVYMQDADCVAIGSDGKLMATGGGDGVRIWDLATATRLHHLEYALTSDLPPEGARTSRDGNGPYRCVFDVHCVSFSPDGRYLFCGTTDGRVNVADTMAGRELASWVGHKGAVRALAISSDGQLLASGGADRTIRLWEAATGRELARWESHEEAVTALAFSPDGKRLASGGADRTVKLWDLDLIRRELAVLGLNW